MNMILEGNHPHPRNIWTKFHVITFIGSVEEDFLFLTNQKPWWTSWMSGKITGHDFGMVPSKKCHIWSNLTQWFLIRRPKWEKFNTHQISSDGEKLMSAFGTLELKLHYKQFFNQCFTCSKVPITTKVVSLNATQVEVYSIQHYAISLLVTCDMHVVFFGHSNFLHQ